LKLNGDIFKLDCLNPQITLDDYFEQLPFSFHDDEIEIDIEIETETDTESNSIKTTKCKPKLKSKSKEKNYERVFIDHFR